MWKCSTFVFIVTCKNGKLRNVRWFLQIGCHWSCDCRDALWIVNHLFSRSSSEIYCTRSFSRVVSEVWKRYAAVWYSVVSSVVSCLLVFALFLTRMQRNTFNIMFRWQADCADYTVSIDSGSAGFYHLWMYFQCVHLTIFCEIVEMQKKARIET